MRRKKRGGGNLAKVAPTFTFAKDNHMKEYQGRIATYADWLKV